MNDSINGAAAMKLTLLLVASLLVIVSLLLISPATIVGQEQGPAAVGERLAADTLEATVLGNPFVAPKDWSIRVKGPATILEAPEGGSWIALVDLQAKTADEALKAAWQAYRPEATWPVKVTNDLPDRDGWSRLRDECLNANWFTSERRATKNRGVATRLQSAAPTQFVRLLVACSICTYTSGDDGMRKASTWMLEKGIQRNRFSRPHPRR